VEARQRRVFLCAHAAAAWSRGLKIHSATIDPTPGFRGHALHANPLRGIRFNLSLARVRDRAESAIVVYLAGPEAQQRHMGVIPHWRLGEAGQSSRSERDLRHSVNTQAAYRQRPKLASLSEDAMDLFTKLKITAVLAALLMAVVWAVPVPV
jgi:hypothetical protein